MKFGVIRFPGSCDEVDAQLAAQRVGEAVILWHGDRDLQGVDAVIVPGGFSYGDYLRAGAIARFAPVMEEVAEFAARRRARARDLQRLSGPVRGRSAARRAAAQHRLRFIFRQVPLEVASADSPFTRACPRRRPAVDPGQAHHRPLLRAAAELDRLEARGQVLLRYAPGENPNGSLRDIAGVCNEAGNVFGLMPHPEHAVDPLTGSTDGLTIFESIRAHVADRAPV